LSPFSFAFADTAGPVYWTTGCRRAASAATYADRPPVGDLEVHEVEVDRVRVGGRVHEQPVLDVARLRGGRDAGSPVSSVGSLGMNAVARLFSQLTVAGTPRFASIVGPRYAAPPPVARVDPRRDRQPREERLRRPLP
jgi:hypothetical protein